MKRVVLNLPGTFKINEFKGLYVYSPTEKTVYGSVNIPDDVLVPKTHFLPKELNGKRYSVRSGPILILDTRTIKVFGFSFDGDKAPGSKFRRRGLDCIFFRWLLLCWPRFARVPRCWRQSSNSRQGQAGLVSVFVHSKNNFFAGSLR